MNLNDLTISETNRMNGIGYAAFIIKVNKHVLKRTFNSDDLPIYTLSIKEKCKFILSTINIDYNTRTSINDDKYYTRHDIHLGYTYETSDQLIFEIYVHNESVICALKLLCD